MQVPGHRRLLLTGPCFSNSRSSIPAGREIYGTPKVFAQLTVGMDERVMFTETRITDISFTERAVDNASRGKTG